MADDVLFQLAYGMPIPGEDSTFPAPEVLITPSRITVGSDTYALAGASRVSFDCVVLRDNPEGFWAGWVLIAIGILLLRFDFGVVGCAAIVLGVMLVWSTRKRGSYTAQVFLHKGGKREVVYSDQLGSTFISFWLRRNFSREQAKQRVELYHLGMERAKSVAKALGAAIGSPPLA